MRTWIKSTGFALAAAVALGLSGTAGASEAAAPSANPVLLLQVVISLCLPASGSLLRGGACTSLSPRAVECIRC